MKRFHVELTVETDYVTDPESVLSIVKRALQAAVFSVPSISVEPQSVADEINRRSQ